MNKREGAPFRILIFELPVTLMWRRWQRRRRNDRLPFIVRTVWSLLLMQASFHLVLSISSPPLFLPSGWFGARTSDGQCRTGDRESYFVSELVFTASPLKFLVSALSALISDNFFFWSPILIQGTKQACKGVALLSVFGYLLSLYLQLLGCRKFWDGGGVDCLRRRCLQSWR